MRRLIAFFAIIAGVGYFMVKEFPQEIPRDAERLDRMVDTLQNAPPF